MPGDATRLTVSEVTDLLRVRFGLDIDNILDLNLTVASPLFDQKSTNWMRRARTVGINVRTVGSFWKVVPYSLTLPAAQNAIHLLPIWEPGVVASLYGMASWEINPEFFSQELAIAFPELNTVEKQLRVVLNLLHALGRVVGMDVVPHTDRYSEQVLANPGFFEWLIRDDLRIVDHSADVQTYAKNAVFGFVQKHGPAVDGLVIPRNMEEFFSQQLPEKQRLEILFGKSNDYKGRLARRKILVRELYKMGFETAPATMGPPYRGLEVDPSPSAFTVDEEGRSWRDFRIKNPQKFSRAFGPLTRYQLYEPLDNNRNWQIDFSRPKPEVWDYVGEKYAAVQREFGFDFMRGDMSHVQMRPGGVPTGAADDPFYDLLGAVKNHVLREKPWFGYFAESFLAPPDVMAYGDELDHLEASHADSTLGNLQDEPVGSQPFMEMLSDYAGWNETRAVSPNFTILTADKDDPRFDGYYLKGNEARYFIALFLADMPSYMAANFECRDPHPVPAPNEHYSKLYVFQEKSGPKATAGPFIFGQNKTLFDSLTRQKFLADEIFECIKNSRTEWLLRPDRSGEQKVIAWTQGGEARFVFVVNLDCDLAKPAIFLPKTTGLEKAELRLIFSTVEGVETGGNCLKVNGLFAVKNLQPGEGRALKVVD